MLALAPDRQAWSATFRVCGMIQELRATTVNMTKVAAACCAELEINF